MNLTARGKIAGIVGWPVAHSLSPQLHAYWLREHHIDGAYVPLPVAQEDFARVLMSLRKAGFVGVNVTVPHKEAGFAIAHEVDDAAEAARATNLLLFREDRIIGRNTDIDGLTASLTEALGPDALHGGTIAVLGAGGAARAALLAADRLRARSICIVSRQIGRAASVVAALKSQAKAELKAFAWSDWRDAARGIDLLVNATSGGMRGAAPLALDIESLSPRAVVCDLVYNPLHTDFIKAARARGHSTIDGLGMLMHQAVPSFDAFFGVRPAVSSALRTELEKALRHAD